MRPMYELGFTTHHGAYEKHGSFSELQVKGTWISYTATELGEPISVTVTVSRSGRAPGEIRDTLLNRSITIKTERLSLNAAMKVGELLWTLNDRELNDQKMSAVQEERLGEILSQTTKTAEQSKGCMQDSSRLWEALWYECQQANRHGQRSAILLSGQDEIDWFDEVLKSFPIELWNRCNGWQSLSFLRSDSHIEDMSVEGYTILDYSALLKRAREMPAEKKAKAKNAFDECHQTVQTDRRQSGAGTREGKRERRQAEMAKTPKRRKSATAPFQGLMSVLLPVFFGQLLMFLQFFIQYFCPHQGFFAGFLAGTGVTLCWLFACKLIAMLARNGRKDGGDEE